MDDSRLPLLGRPVEQGHTSNNETDQGRSIDLPPLQPSTGASRPVPESTQEQTKAKNTAPNEENAVGERAANPYSSTTASSTTTATMGLPILSGPPPIVESEECRTCGKNFIPLFRKNHTCHHCGHSYCSDHCSDHSALMPRRGVAARQAPGSNSVGVGPRGGGYEMVEVCDFCFPMLQVASGNTQYLRSLPLKRLQGFIKAYNLNPAAVSAIEKEDFVQLIIKAKDPRSGCMPVAAESFYRRRSVPKQGVLPDPATTNTTRRNPAVRTPPGPAAGSRPSPAASGQTPRAPPRPQQQPQPQQNYRPPPQHPPTTNGYQARPPYTAPRPPQPAPRTTAAPHKPAPAPKRIPSPPVPELISLVPLPLSYISSLSIGTLKAILYENHVKVDFAQVLEKGELITRVQELIKVERKRLERLAKEEEQEEAEAEALPSTPPGSTPVVSKQGESSVDDPVGSLPRETAEIRSKPPKGPPAAVERDGLCVVCQDQDAELAVVDCGHLSMCQDCSKLVMSTSKECPLCRTRIITDRRLIRIFRT